ncbi:MetQ/NlpA family ABC transporter substrate-binding protein [Roseomonas gilardii subsp. gilardii]|uniref:MetQ/NlpA family ABC transporter substrate-binding protein n=1 Tax=Roseomonas gilardii TaxID=257708 RepID=UPI001FF75013|nr:MetQ/NlpA family ABC transporter substrate-binding protein [Roseomonas gilardii]UPG73504.1 MetQ/NlpA family ABC transporter substrate-binding protein [Roseomonas gilardii subsp. gilardii]
MQRRPLLAAGLLAGGMLLRPALLRAQTGNQAAEIGSAARPLSIGVTAGPHAQVTEKVRELAAKDGLVLRLVEFTDFIQPNAALASGDLDSNSYQHRPFLEQQIRDRGYRLAAVAKTLVFPLGVYARKYKALSDLPQGGRVAIPNDPSNGGRALLLLAKAGLIGLTPGMDFRATVADITENPKRLRIVELEAAQVARSLDDVDAAVVITDYALIAGLDPAKDALFREDADSPYANLLVVREADRDAPWVKRLVAAYHRDEIRAFVRDTFHGNVVPAF